MKNFQHLVSKSNLETIGNKKQQKQIKLYRWEPGQLALDVVQLGLGTLNGHLTLEKKLENYSIM